MTGRINRLRPVERSQCERQCHSAMEQRADIKVCYKLGKTATETREILVQVYGREAVSIKCVYVWFKRFREGKETTEDEPRSGRPLTSRTPKMIEKGRQSSFSNLSVASHTSQFILQPFRRFTYATAHLPTLSLLHLRHSSFSNPSVALPTTQLIFQRFVASPTSQFILQPFRRFTYVTAHLGE